MIVAGVFWSIRKYGVGGGVWVRLQLGPKWCQMYIMVYFQKQVNCNGTTIVSREVMARFKYGKIIMAQIQLTLRTNMPLEGSVWFVLKTTLLILVML